MPKLHLSKDCGHLPCSAKILASVEKVTLYVPGLGHRDVKEVNLLLTGRLFSRRPCCKEYSSEHLKTTTGDPWQRRVLRTPHPGARGSVCNSCSVPSSCTTGGTQVSVRVTLPADQSLQICIANVDADTVACMHADGGGVELRLQPVHKSVVAISIPSTEA